MGNFLVVGSLSSANSEFESVFGRGLAAARCLNLGCPSSVVETTWASAASFARENGSGSTVVTDEKSGSWLLSIGTWFHSQERLQGSSVFLLDRYLRVGGLQLAKELEGFFVIVVGDARTHQIFVVTDLIGSCHAFFWLCDSMVIVSGSSLIPAVLGDATLDPIGCQEFLSTGACYESRSLFSEVNKLEPASLYCFSNGQLKRKTRYWQLNDLEPESLDGSRAVAALTDALVAGVTKIHAKFARPVCDSTGGYDSRAVVAAFIQQGAPFSTTVSGLLQSKDVLVSKDIALQLHLPHVHMEGNQTLTYADLKRALRWTDGEYDLVEYGRIANIHRELAQRFDISINGSFGEVGRGYWWELLFPRLGAHEKLDTRKLAEKRFAAHVFDARLFPPDRRLDLISHFTDIIERTNAGSFELPNTLQMDHAYLMMRMQRWQGRIASSTNRIWPCFSLFLLKSVLETLLQTNSRLRHNGLLIREMLAKTQPRLAAIPLEHGYPAVPIAWNTIHRFWPLPVHLGRRATNKALRVIKVKLGLPINTNRDTSVRNQLWLDEEVREVLHPREMTLEMLVDAPALSNFILSSKSEPFPFNDQWNRILTVETLLRQIKNVRKSVSIQDSLAKDTRQLH